MPRFVGAVSSCPKCALPRGGTWRVSFRHRCLRDLGHFGNQKSYGTGAKTCKQAGMSRNSKNQGLFADANPGEDKIMAYVNAKNLQQLKNLSSFSLSQLEKFADNLSVRNYRKNEIVFDQDQEAKLVYLVISGVARVSYLNTHENQTIVSLLPAGEFFGLASLVPKPHHPYRCEAFQHSVVGSIRPQTFIEILL